MKFTISAVIRFFLLCLPSIYETFPDLVRYCLHSIFLLKFLSCFIFFLFPILLLRIIFICSCLSFLFSCSLFSRHSSSFHLFLILSTDPTYLYILSSLLFILSSFVSFVFYYLLLYLFTIFYICSLHSFASGQPWPLLKIHSMRSVVFKLATFQMILTRFLTIAKAVLSKRSRISSKVYLANSFLQCVPESLEFTISLGEKNWKSSKLYLPLVLHRLSFDARIE